MCCTSLLKVMMFIFNGAIFVAGAAVLGVGVWVTVDSGSFMGLLEEVESIPDQVYQLVNVGYVMIGVGSVLLVIGFLGCCGAIKESRCMLLTFFSIVLVIFIAEVAGAVVLFVFQDQVDEVFEGLENEIRGILQNKYGSDEKMTSLWNATMQEFKCCGYSNYTDFEGSPFNTQFGNPYPTPCCKSDLSGLCNKREADDAAIDGCFQKLVRFLEENSGIIAAVALGIAALEIAAMVVSMVLYCNAGRKSR